MSEKLQEEKEIIKLERIIGAEKANAYRAMTTEQLKTEMSKLNSDREANRQAQKDDPQLEEASNKKKELARPYNEFKKYNQALTSFVYQTLKEKGGN